MEIAYLHSYTIAQFLFIKGVGAVYLCAFANVVDEFNALLGKDGLLPASHTIQKVTFRQKPSIFHFYYSDAFVKSIGWFGIVCSIAVILGTPLIGPWWVTSILCAILWICYLSVVNIGRIWYSFGWESMLLEAGFYTIFLGSTATAAPILVVFIIRWMLFRVEFGAGCIKIRGDQCWRDLTCMDYHHETQPMPNPLSWFFHNLPQWFHKIETGFNHFVQLIVPFGLFFPQPIASIAAVLIILSQSYLLINGNYSWLNFLTIVLAFFGISDAAYSSIFQVAGIHLVHAPTLLTISAVLLTVLVGYLSIKPIKNLVSAGQLMNYSFNPLHLVNTYGAFGTVTKTRYEIVVAGTRDSHINKNTTWKEYHFRGKPTDTHRLPPQIAPYHLRLDWLMWFAAIDAGRGNRSAVVLKHRWFQSFIDSLLDGDEQLRTLLKDDPFAPHGPKFVRADVYRYRFTTPKEWWQTGKWWYRQKEYTLIPPQSRS